MSKALRNRARMARATSHLGVFVATMVATDCGPPTPEGTPPKNGVAVSHDTKAEGPTSSSGDSAGSTKRGATCRNACRKESPDVASIRDEWDACNKLCLDGDTDCSADCDDIRASHCDGLEDACDAIDACFEDC
jgi:hypothetical protein